jgi:hypothetical protein
MTCVALGLLGTLGLIVPMSAGILLLYGALRTIVMLFRNLPLLFVFVALGVGSSLFPPLAIVAVILVIWLIVRRLAYLYTHRRVIGFGTVLYLLAGLQIPVALALLPIVVGWVRAEPLDAALVLVPLLCTGGLIVSVLADRQLREFYAVGYTTEQIHELSSTVPFIFLLLILSIIGIGADFGLDSPVEAPVDGVDPVPDLAPDADVVPGAARTADVAAYIRSNPDGIVENNLSFEGDVPPGTPEPTGLHAVRGHIRTVADGVPENNLSYRDGVHDLPPEIVRVPVPEAPSVAPRVWAGEAAAAATHRPRDRDQVIGPRCPRCGGSLPRKARGRSRSCPRCTA